MEGVEIVAIATWYILPTDVEGALLIAPAVFSEHNICS